MFDVGVITGYTNENKDVNVNFIRCCDSLLLWPTESARDHCWVPYTHVACIINAPDVQSRAGR